MMVENVVADPVTIDRSVISWLMAAGGAFILFLLSLGIKDLKGRIDRIPLIGEEVLKVRAETERELTGLYKTVDNLEERIKELHAEIARLKDVVHAVHR